MLKRLLYTAEIGIQSTTYEYDLVKIINNTMTILMKYYIESRLYEALRNVYIKEIRVTNL